MDSDTYTTGRELLKLAGTGYEDYQPEEVVEEPGYESGIPWAKEVRTGRVVRIPLTPTTRIGIFGQSGASKTTLAKAGLSRALKNGYQAFHGSDVKNDFQSLNYQGGVSEELVRKTQGLLPGESPASFNRVLAVPYFLAGHYQSDIDYGTRFAVSLSDLSESEFKFLAGYNSWQSSAAKETLDTMLMDLDLSEMSLGYVSRENESGEGLIFEAFKRDQSTLVRKLQALKSKKLVSERVNHNMRDILAYLNDVGAVSLGLKHFDQHMNGEEHFFQFYVAKGLRQLKQMVRRGDVEVPNGLVVFMDEFHKLAPQGSKSLVREEFQDFYDVSGRQLGVSTVISSQRPSQLPNPENDDDMDFVGNLSHAFLLRGRTQPTESDWKMVVRALGVYDGSGGRELDVWRRKIQGLDRFQGVFIDAERHRGPWDCPVVETLAPLMSHPG